ncbi:MAG TPA: TetR/AcrR family transcriptional regulator, partial [Blastocatellia bacterium]|nr:TetR/AcrR family transcriptional regulator [Blastocatellia bacterium]
MQSGALDQGQPSRMSGPNRRQQIVAVAAELFARKGFSGTTTKEIAEGAGVSEAIIFRHFASKETLYAAILDYKVKQGTERMKAQLEEAAGRKDDHAFFGSLALEMLDFHSKDRTFMRLLLFSALEGHELSNIFFDSTARDIKNHIRKYIKQRISDGAFRSIDPAVAARAFVGMVLHQVQASTIFTDDDVKLSNRQIADRFVEIFLNGVRESES